MTLRQLIEGLCFLGISFPGLSFVFDPLRLVEGIVFSFFTSPKTVKLFFFFLKYTNSLTLVREPRSYLLRFTHLFIYSFF